MKLSAYWMFAAALAAALGFNPRESLAQSPKPAPACLSPGAWATLEGEKIQKARAPALLADMVKQDVVLLGETHDEEDHHLWQFQVLAALHAQRPDMVIGFEMFPRRVQPVLDRWVAGELTVKQFLEQSEWDKVWNMPAELYVPLFQFARINRIPMLALNVNRSLTEAITEKGWDAVPESEREGVGRPAPPQPAYLDFLFEVHREHAKMRGKDSKGGKAGRNDPAFRRFVESQTAWDRAMAEALAGKVLPANAASRPLAVGVMGGGHVRFGHGVPHQLRALGVTNIGTLLPVPANADCVEIRAGMADAVFAVPHQPRPEAEPPRLGVSLDQTGDGVRIAEVIAGSLAERSGLKAGDRLLEMGGKPVTRAAQASAAVRRPPDGTWLPMRVKRADQTLDLVIKFPPKP